MHSFKDQVSSLLRRIFPNLFTPPLTTSPKADLHGAITGTLASITQTLAYGLIIGGALGSSLNGAGMLIALYSSVLLGLSAALLGGCPYLVAGPRASALLVFAALISHLSHSAAFAHLSEPGLLALMLACTAVLGSGLVQILFGCLRMGQIANYVPLPVMAGFLNGSALLIILSQIWPATGMHPQSSIADFFRHLNDIKPATVLLALATATAVLGLPRLTRRVPAALLAFLAGTLIFHLLSAFGYGNALGGTLPPPPDHFPFGFIGKDAFQLLTGPYRNELLPPILAAAVSMAILSSLDTLLSTTAADTLTHHRSNSNRQLIAEGLGNAIAGLFSMAPGSSGIARTQAALSGGMVSAAAPIGIALITLILTMMLSPLIGWLSQAVMAGLLIAIGFELIDTWSLRRIRRLLSQRTGPSAARGDLLIVAVVVMTALLLNLATAVYLGVALSLITFVIQMAHSPVRRCYRASALIPLIDGDPARSDFIQTHGKKIAVIEAEGTLFFGSVRELENQVAELMSDNVAHVVLDLKRIKHIDSTGAHAMERMSAKLNQQGGLLVISHVDRERRQSQATFTGQDKRRNSIARNNWLQLNYLETVAAIGEDYFVGDNDAAVALCEKHLSRPAGPLPMDLRAAYLSIWTLDRSRLRQLRHFWARVSFAKDDLIFAQGSSTDGVFFLLSGRVDVLIDIPGTERKRKVQSLTAGSIFGEMALLDQSPRSATVVASELTECCWISATNFERIKKEHPEAAFWLLTNIAMIFARRLRASTNMLAEMDA
jgi:SulP family sulfate permease